MRYTTIAALLLGLLAAVGFGCVSAPVVQCPEEFLQKPPITLEHFAEPFAVKANV